VGFYGLPHKQYWPQPQLNATQRGWNDMLLPLWEASTALYPSIYLPYESGCNNNPLCQTLKLNTAFVDATVGEATRVSKLAGRAAPKPVIPYAWNLYHPEGPFAHQVRTPPCWPRSWVNFSLL
jgi:hypothetical protein